MKLTNEQKLLTKWIQKTYGGVKTELMNENTIMIAGGDSFTVEQGDIINTLTREVVCKNAAEKNTVNKELKNFFIAGKVHMQRKGR